MENRDALRYISDAFRDDRPKNSTKGFRPRQAKPQVRYGGTCQSCWTKKSLTGECACT